VRNYFLRQLFLLFQGQLLYHVPHPKTVLHGYPIY